MKIMHVCLANFYIDNYGYQENILPRMNKLQGHDVLIVASTETFVNNSKIGYTKPSHYINSDGIPVHRLAYSAWLPARLMYKFRYYKGFYGEMEQFQPDIILFHGPCAGALLEAAQYAKKSSHVKLYVDSHEDYFNSARNFASRNILHQMYYKPIVKKSLKYIRKILCISYDTMDFMASLYGIPKDKLEFFPLGGIVFSDNEKIEKRSIVRESLKIKEDDILFAHSGKMDVLKRTDEIIKAFSSVNNSHFRLILIGSVSEEYKKTLMELIEQDSRISYLGWKKPEELSNYLCACDMYVQPGSQSATMQNALCSQVPVMLYPYKSHEPYLKGNGFYVETLDDIRNAFQNISNNPDQLKIMSVNSKKIAEELLDYRKLAARLCE